MHAERRLDLRDRATLVKSWLATLHDGELTLRPRVTGPLPGWGALLRTALAWHVAYALVSYGSALAVSRSGSSNAVAQAVQSAGTAGVVLLTLALWWGGVALSSVAWWLGVLRVRQLS
ncbi:MAG: hypothetical protein WCD35_06930 [Mycobacteriales bacterium]